MQEIQLPLDEIICVCSIAAKNYAAVSVSLRWYCFCSGAVSFEAQWVNNEFSN